MLLSILFSILSAVLAYIIIVVIHVVFRNSKDHKFFRKYSPNLPVLPNANIFTGHLYKTILANRSCEAFDEFHKTYGPTFGFYRFN